MKKTNLFLVLFICIIIQFSYSQVGIGTTTPNPSAILDLTATNKALLLPRVTSTSISVIASPQNGLIVYDVSQNCFKSYENNAWTACWSSSTSGRVSSLNQVALISKDEFEKLEQKEIIKSK